jgi:hypothetical protein
MWSEVKICSSFTCTRCGMWEMYVCSGTKSEVNKHWWWTLFWIWCSMWHGSRWYTSNQHSHHTFKHLLHHVSKACILALKTFMSRAFSQVMTACLRAASVACCFPGRCFLGGPNKGKIPGPCTSYHIGCSGYGPQSLQSSSDMQCTP